MIRKLYFSITLFSISIGLCFAQQDTDAQKVIDNILQSVRTEAVRTDFRMEMKDKKSVNSQSVSGTFLLKGSQFYLKMNDAQVWFNGKTQWSYSASSNEVNITEPTESELAETNPMAILSAYRNKSVIRFAKSTNNAIQSIDLTAKVKSGDFVKVNVQVDKKSNVLKSMSVTQKSGKSIKLTMNQYERGVSTSANNFVFDAKKFKNVIINDLR